MDLLTKLERKYGKYSIPNLTVILIMGFVVGYLIEIILDPSALEVIALNPEKVLQGQIYRLFTWIVIPPYGISIWVLLVLFFYLSIGRTLENVMGDFRYTVYIVSGILFTDIGVMLAYIVMKVSGQTSVMYYYSMHGASTYYLCMSMFLVYAFMFPENQVYLYMIIPVKIKWLGYFDIAYLIYEMLLAGLNHYYAGMITILMSMLNFIVFYRISRGRMSFAHKKRKRYYRQQVKQTQILTRHKCAICGQTEENQPQLEFRYCSRCKGNYEYCQNHLFTHEHKK